MKKVNIGLLVGIALVTMVGMSALALSGAFGNASKYTSFTEAKKSGDDVHVVGKWVMREQATYDAATDQFHFYLQDSTKTISQVVYHDPQPVNFETAEKVVVQGKYEGEVFDAKRIFMKCPSKYNAGEMDPGLAGDQVQ